MSIFIFIAAIAVLFVLQCVFIVFLLRSIQSSIYSDIADIVHDYLLPAKDGELSKFGIIINGLAATMAQTLADGLFQKIKSSAIGSKGGSSSRSPSDPLGGLLPLILNRFVPGGLSGLMGNGPGDNHSSDNHNSNAQPKFRL